MVELKRDIIDDQGKKSTQSYKGKLESPCLLILIPNDLTKLDIDPKDGLKYNQLIDFSMGLQREGHTRMASISLGVRDYGAKVL